MGNTPGQSRDRGFRDVDTLRTANDIIGIISSREDASSKTGRVYTFCILKEFLRDGKVEKTSFFPAKLAPDVSRMIDMLSKRIGELVLEDDLKAAKASA